MVFDEFFLNQQVREVYTNYLSFFFQRYFVCRLQFYFFSNYTLYQSYSISFQNFLWAIFREFYATAFFYLNSLRLFCEISMFYISRWLLMMSFMEMYFFTYFLSVVSLFTLSYLRFCTLFSLNYSKFIAFSPYFLHLSIYCFQSQSIATFLFYNAYCFCLYLILSPSNTSFCFLISSTSLVNLDPSQFFSFFSIIFSCFLLTIVRFFISSLSYRICYSFFFILDYIYKRSSAVNLCLLFFFCRFFSSF